MNVDRFFDPLNHAEKLRVLDLTLPGIEVYLKDVLSQENLTEVGEKLRLHYIKLLENSNSSSVNVQESEELIDLKEADIGSLETPPIQVSRFGFDGSEVNITPHNDTDECTNGKLQEQAAKRPRPRRKGTDSTEESGVFTSAQSSGGLSVSSPQLDVLDNSSKDTFVSDSECEFLEWESDYNVTEDGYCTGDNIESYLENFQLQPNEHGELYMGVMYVREQPGWHKRWLIITERCLKCYKHRTDDKMLFEIPLQNAKIIPTDRKRRRMFPITLSIPRLKDAITFATTEEQTRQEWIYVINHVIAKLAEEEPLQEYMEYQRRISFNTLLLSHSAEELQTRLLSRERISGTSDAGIAASNSVSDKDNTCSSVRLEVPSERDKRRTWHAGSVAEMGGSLAQLRTGVTQDESPDMDTSLSHPLAGEESFRELQECLPDILQKPSSLSMHRRGSGASVVKSSVSDRKRLSFNSEADIRTLSTSDLSAQPRIKRHGSLANSLSSKAAKVKSKLFLNNSFFKKGKREDRVQHQLSQPSTTFSGYLSRKKGNTWKSRWCVVKEHSLLCYKDFGVGLAELELTLGGCVITAVPEGEGEKPFMFILTADKEELHFAAENDAELEEWIMVLEKETQGVSSIPEQTQEIPTEDDEGHRMTTLSSQDSVEETVKSDGTDQHAKRSHASLKALKDIKAQASARKSSMLGAIAHKFGKSKTKHSKDAKTSSTDEHDVTDGFVMAPHQDKDDGENEESLLGEGPTMEGILYQWANQNWTRCSVRLSHHTLHIKDDSETSSVFKFSLINCVVLDCTDTENPLVMGIKTNAGQPLYLKAETKSDFLEWKDTILAAVLTSPSTTKHLLSKESTTEDETTQKTSVSARVKIGGDSFDSVFSRDDTNSTNSPSTPVSPLVVDSYPSPRPSTAGDVSSAESEDDLKPPAFSIPIHRSTSAGGIDRLRTQSAVHSARGRRRGSPLRRTISNALASLDLSPNKRRSKTFAGLGIAASLLFGIKHTSCLYLRNSKGAWTKRWCVLQQGKLHFFNSGDDLSPKLTIPLRGCKVKKVQMKGKQFTFELKIPSENVECCLAAQSEKELTRWTDMLKAEASGEGSDALKHSGLDLLDGIIPRLKNDAIKKESKPDVALGSELADSENNNNISRDKSASLLELRRIRETVTSDDETLPKSDNHKISPTVRRKATSLEEVLTLLHEQQLLQNLGQTRYNRAKKARVNWKKSARAILKDQSSRSESPDIEKKKDEDTEEERMSEAGSETRTKSRATSIISLSSDIDDALSCQNPKDALGRFEKLAEEEKLKALKTETLLRKRRNSLNLEKEVLEKKIDKNKEKKGSVKKLLGKDHTADKEGIIRAQKRLKEVNEKLANVNHDIEQNKSNEIEIMDNINELKTKSAREFPIKRYTSDERRALFKHSPQGSTSSHESFDGAVDTHRSSTSSLDTSLKRMDSKTQASLVVLEQELKKISPVGGRRVPGIRKRVSISSEGSIDENSAIGTPIPESGAMSGTDKRDSSSSEGSLYAFERLNSFSSEAAEGRRRTLTSPSFKKSELHNVAVEIPTRSSSSGSIGEGPSLSSGGENRPSLLTALSQIKDFEDFLASTKR